MRVRFIIATVLLALAAVFVNTHEDVATPLNTSFTLFPVSVGQWEMVGESQFSQDILEVLAASDYLFRKYRGPDGAEVDLYVGYHDGGPDAGPIHSPKNCLPGSGWQVRSEETIKTPVPGGEMPVVRSEYSKGDRSDIFYYWYQVCGNTVTNEYALKLSEALCSMQAGRRDSAFIRISMTRRPGMGDPDETLAAFVRDFQPVIRSFLPQ